MKGCLLQLWRNLSQGKRMSLVEAKVFKLESSPSQQTEPGATQDKMQDRPGRSVDNRLPRYSPYLNPDPYCRWVGPTNTGEAIIEGQCANCLLDNGAVVNLVTPEYA